MTKLLKNYCTLRPLKIIGLNQLKGILVFVILFISCSKNNNSTPNVPPVPAGKDVLNNWIKTTKQGNSVQDIWLINRTSGYFVNENGIFSPSANWNTWMLKPGTEALNTFNLQFVDSLTGFAQGQNQLGITSDGGILWSIKNLPPGFAIYFQFTNASTGFFYDRNLGLYKTQDTGTSLNPVFPVTASSQSYPFFFLDSLNGFTLINNTVHKTVDGGLNWQFITGTTPFSGFDGYYRMQFLDLNNGFCGSILGLFLTTNGGTNWKNILSSSSGYIIPQFFDINNGYCLTANAIFKTTNGGTSWTLSCSLGDDKFSSMHMLDMNTGLASTFGGYVLKLGL